MKVVVAGAAGNPRPHIVRELRGCDVEADAVVNDLPRLIGRETRTVTKFLTDQRRLFTS